MRLKELKRISKFLLSSVLFSVLSVLMVAGLLIVGCNKTGGESSSSEDEITFTVGSMPNTKTAYDPARPLQLIWVTGDQVSIYCDQAGGDSGEPGPGKTKADYAVTPIAATPEKGTLSKAASENEKGLRWGNNVQHNLYAVYPSIGTSYGNVAKVSGEEGGFTFDFPKTQNCSKTGVTPTSGKYMLKPEMYLAYMVAEPQSLMPTTKPAKLLFKPIATTLEITLQGATHDDVEISELQLSVKNIAGNFVKYDNAESKYQIHFDSKKNFSTDVSNALVAYPASANTVNTADFTVKITEGNFQLKAGESVTFTVFLPPIKNLKDVDVTCLDGNGVSLGKKVILTTAVANPASKSFIKLPQFNIKIYTISDYYQWDAQAPYNPANWTEPFGPNLSGYNRNDYDYDSNNNPIAKYSCAGAPTLEQLKMYLGAGVYWVTDGPTYMSPDGKVYRTGLMLKKAANIPNFYLGTAPKKTKVTPTKGSYESLKEDYFFLPACGYYYAGSFDFAGAYGYYWSSTPSTTLADYAYRLYFTSGTAYVDALSNGPDFGNRYDGFLRLIGFDPTYAKVKEITLSPDPLDIERGQTGTLRVTKVTMSDGSTLTPTTGFTWKINPPNGVVTDANGGVVSPSPQQIVTGNTTTNNTNTITLSTGAYFGSTTVTVTYGGKSATAAVNVYRNFKQSNYYMWDAPVDEPYNYPTENYNDNKDAKGVATQSCVNAPTVYELQRYLAAGVYWVTDGPPYKMPINGVIYRTGLMVKQKAYIPGFADTKLNDEKEFIPSEDFTSLSSAEKAQYFFLSACGEYGTDGNNNPFIYPDYGYYWTSTSYYPDEFFSGACGLKFTRGSARVEGLQLIFGFKRYAGMVPMPKL